MALRLQAREAVSKRLQARQEQHADGDSIVPGQWWPLAMPKKKIESEAELDATLVEVQKGESGLAANAAQAASDQKAKRLARLRRQQAVLDSVHEAVAARQSRDEARIEASRSNIAAMERVQEKQKRDTVQHAADVRRRAEHRSAAAVATAAAANGSRPGRSVVSEAGGVLFPARCCSLANKSPVSSPAFPYGCRAYRGHLSN
eukprot:SAG31_NODE_2508_length_5589_cov_11.540073_5_plen_203_part_00